MRVRVVLLRIMLVVVRCPCLLRLWFRVGVLWGVLIMRMFMSLILLRIVLSLVLRVWRWMSLFICRILLLVTRLSRRRLMVL